MVKGELFFDNQSDYMDDMFYDEVICGKKDPQHRELQIITDKLTKESFNFTVPLRDYFLEEQFEEIGLENTLENRKAFYEMLYSTPNLGNYTSGAILTDELIR